MILFEEIVKILRGQHEQIGSILESLRLQIILNGRFIRDIEVLQIWCLLLTIYCAVLSFKTWRK